jgi:hypothetical protein
MRKMLVGARKFQNLPPPTKSEAEDGRMMMSFAPLDIMPFF